MSSSIPSDPTIGPKSSVPPLTPTSPTEGASLAGKVAKAVEGAQHSPSESGGELPSVRPIRMSTGGDLVSDVARAAGLLDLSLAGITLVTSDQFKGRSAPQLERQDTQYAPLGSAEFRRQVFGIESNAEGDIAAPKDTDVADESIERAEQRASLDREISENETYDVSTKNLIVLINRLKDFVQLKLGLGEEATQLGDLKTQVEEGRTDQDRITFFGRDIKAYQEGIHSIGNQAGATVQEKVQAIIRLFAKVLVGDAEAKGHQIMVNLDILKGSVVLISADMRGAFESEIARLENKTSTVLQRPLEERQAVIKQLKEIEQQLQQLQSLMALEEEYSNLQEELAAINKGAYRSLPELIQADAHVRQINAETGINRLTADALMQIRGDLDKVMRVNQGIVSTALPADASDKVLLVDFERSVVQPTSLQFPPLPIARGPIEGEGKKSDFNNYGLIPDPGSVVMDGNRLVSFKIGGEIHENKNPMALVKDGKIYLYSAVSKYHDATGYATTAKGTKILTVCDGAGQHDSSTIAAQTAAQASEDFLMTHIDQAKNLQEQVATQLRGIKAAHDKMALQEDGGSTTFVQCALAGNILSGVSLGDSKAFIFRPKSEGGWSCIDASHYYKGVFDTKNPGGALHTGVSEVSKLRAFAMGLKTGDVVYLCSDGVVDGFEPVSTDRFNGRGIEWDDNPQTNPHLAEDIAYADREMATRMENVIKEARTGAEIQQTIEIYLGRATQERKIRSFEDSRFKIEDRDGAKLDDAGSVFFEFRGIGA